MVAILKWSIVRSEGTALIGRYLKPDTDLYIKRGVMGRPKVALIDLNKTLIISRSGSLHGADENDWKWWDDNVPIRLRGLEDQGYTIIISSNQGRLTDCNGNESAEAKPFKLKLGLILKELDVSATVIVACANDIFRKPRPGIWSLIATHTGNDELVLDKQHSFVVGDAAGRVGDHSDSDLHLALNLGVKFYTPENFFKGHPEGPLGHQFDPSWYIDSYHGDSNKSQTFRRVLNVNNIAQNHATLTSPLARSLIVLVGLPGAGKTTFYNKFLAPLGYKRVESESFTSSDQCKQRIEELLNKGFSIVIDESNVNRAARQPWILLAKQHQIMIRAFFFTASVDLCLHNDSFRALAGLEYDPERKPIFPRIRFLELVSLLEKPTEAEGFDQIMNIDFEWNGDAEKLQIWKKYWH